MADPKERTGSEPLRRLRAEASEAARRGQLRRALDRYRQLEAAEPDDARWCCLVAEVHGRLGEKAEEIAALARAVSAFTREGSAFRAIATSKRILDLDPNHPAALLRLAGVRNEKAAPATLLAGARIPETGAPLAPQALPEILLEDVLPGEAASPGLRGLLIGEDTDAEAVADRVLPRVPLFGDLAPESFERLLRSVRLSRLREDQLLFREGDPGDALYVVVEGAVVPSAERPVQRRLAVLQEGDFFGEVALVTDQPRIATVRALVDTTLLALDADAVRALLRREPGLAVAFLRFLRERLLHRLGQTSPLFRGLDAAALRRLAARFRFFDVEDRAELVSQGDTRPGLFIALCGRFEVWIHDGVEARSLAELETGDVFGEMSLLSGEPALATVTARGRGFVLALEAKAWEGLRAAHPALEEGLRALAAERDRRNAASLRDFGDAFRRRIDLV